eukprot:COSAG03_NODE_8997_length_753_cov_1.108563_1_plen_55_part_10
MMNQPSSPANSIVAANGCMACRISGRRVSRGGGIVVEIAAVCCTVSAIPNRWGTF